MTGVDPHQGMHDPRLILLGGIFLLFLGVASMLTGEAILPSRGNSRMVYRSEDPKNFWWSVAAWCLTGVGLIGYFLYLIV